jgi:hypothetical protein
MKKKAVLKLADVQWMIKTIADRISAKNPIDNNKKNTQIDKINNLESDYLNLKAKEMQKEFVNDLNHYDFYRIEGHLGKISNSDSDVFKEYIRYLEEKISKEKRIALALEGKLEDEHHIQIKTHKAS